VAEEKVIIDALKEPGFNIKRDFKNLLNTITLLTAEHKEVVVIKKKLVDDKKLEKRERLKKKKKKTDSADSEDVKAAQTISEAMTIMPTLCNLINCSVCKHKSSGKYSIALADLSSSVPANWKWSTKRINVFMGYLNPTAFSMFHQLFKWFVTVANPITSDAHRIIMTSSADKLATTMASIRPTVTTSTYILIHLVSCLILNVCTKGNIQHNSTYHHPKSLCMCMQ
jgi:hypothetical protein